MSKFKVGDTVRWLGATIKGGVQEDGVYTVGACHCVHDWIGLVELPEDDRTPYATGKFALVESAPEQPAVLTPLEVFQCILEGTPLEYSIKKLSGERTWHTVTNPKHIDLEDIECAEYRKKPPTVLINGIDVPKTVLLPEGTYVWYPSVACGVVQSGVVSHLLPNYWATKEDAQAVLDAILTSFSK